MPKHRADHTLEDLEKDRRWYERTHPTRDEPITLQNFGVRKCEQTGGNWRSLIDANALTELIGDTETVAERWNMTKDDFQEWKWGIEGKGRNSIHDAHKPLRTFDEVLDELKTTEGSKPGLEEAIEQYRKKPEHRYNYCEYFPVNDVIVNRIANKGIVYVEEGGSRAGKWGSPERLTVDIEDVHRFKFNNMGEVLDTSKKLSPEYWESYLLAFRTNNGIVTLQSHGHRGEIMELEGWPPHDFAVQLKMSRKRVSQDTGQPMDQLTPEGEKDAKIDAVQVFFRGFPDLLKEGLELDILTEDEYYTITKRLQKAERGG